MARPQIADGGNDLHIWRVAAKISSKQPREAENMWSFSLWVGQGTETSWR